MIKLDIIMSKEALLQYINQPEESDSTFDRWLSLKALIRQHNIVVSDTLIQVYEDYFTNEGYGDLFQTYYISQS